MTLNPGSNLLSNLGANSDSFKIIVTTQPHGAVPAALWHSAYVVFARDEAV